MSATELSTAAPPLVYFAVTARIATPPRLLRTVIDPFPRWTASSNLGAAMAARVEHPARARRRGAIRLGGAYLRAIEKLEALPQNQSGADKSWVERAIRSWRELCRKAVPVR